MNIIIIGCGKTGRALATELDELGHDVAVIDPEKSKFDILPEAFGGICVHGSGIDSDVLKRAGAENADVAVVVTRNDNLNIMAAKVLSDVFSVNDVYVRVFDASREAVFRKFGLRTVCSTRIEKEIFLSLLLGETNDIKPVNIAGTSVGFNMEKAEKKNIGKKITDILTKNNEMLFAVKKQNGALFLAKDYELPVEEGDMLIYALI